MLNNVLHTLASTPVAKGMASVAVEFWRLDSYNKTNQMH